ncbi:hypothetical protein BG006_002756, partial [Podila minutissima]
MAPDPVIVIVGAGIAGLTLAIMLERAGMPRYVVLERHASLKPLGSALLLSAMSLRCFDQLGLLPEIIKISKPQVGSVWLDEHMNYLGDFDGSFIGKRYGYFNVVMTRPDLVDILARHVPAHKIHYSKKVLSLTQTSESATVRCSDYSVYQGDIVIGADGAYSGIRQNIYKAIQAEYQEINVASLDNKRFNSVVKPLPISDMAPLRFDQHAIVGVTGKLDADKYPFLREKACQSITVFRGSLSKRSKLSSVFKGKEGPAENFKISEWAPDAVDDMLNLKTLRDQTSPYGGTIGDLFDKTPKGNAVKIMLEDKSFKTWFYKRTVLVGDACHKLIPFSGVGSVHAIMDCITLMNALFDMPDGDQFTATDITKAFRTYRALRYKSATAAVKGSRQTSHILSGTGTLNELIRKGTVRGMPQYLISVAADRIFCSRPILTYLPFVPDYGTRKSDPQPLGRRDREELELLRARQRVERENQLKAKRSMTLTNQGSRLSVGGILRGGAQRILQTSSMASSATTLLRGGQVTKALPPSSSSSSSLSTSSGLLALDLPKHNNLMARPQFLKRSVAAPSPRASARASGVSSMTHDSTDAISISSTISTTTTASRASVYSYYSSAIEDYKLMQTSNPSHAKSSVTFRAGFGESTSTSTQSSSGTGTFGQAAGSRGFHDREASANETTDEDEDDAYSVTNDCTGPCCAGPVYTESTYTESSCSCSMYSKSIYSDSDLEAERGVAPSLPYTERDLCGYYIRERSVYPYMDTRHQEKVFHSKVFVRRERSRDNVQVEEEDDDDDDDDNDGGGDDDTATIRAIHPSRQHRRSSYDSELGERRRDSSASLVSSLFRRYGISGSSSDVSRGSSTATGYDDLAAKPESSLLNLPV